MTAERTRRRRKSAFAKWAFHSHPFMMFVHAELGEIVDGKSRAANRGKRSPSSTVREWRCKTSQPLLFYTKRPSGMALVFD